jgi:thioredoxin-disulfide reductase
MYDLIIIGAGPAGITAGIYAARKKLKTLLLVRDLVGQAGKISEIENWPGEKNISGMSLMQNLLDHLRGFEIEIKEGEIATDIKKKGEFFEIKTKRGNSYSTKTIVVASGRTQRHLGVPGEEEFTGRGVSICSTCDAPFYKDKIVAVVGGGNAGFRTALDLIPYASKIYILDASGKIRADEAFQEKANQSGKIEIIFNAKVLEIKGEKRAEHLLYQDVLTKEQKELPVGGVFIEIGSVPATEFLDGFVDFTKSGDVAINPKTCETKTPGIFAAGDVTDVVYKQLIIASGEGAKAALSAHNYLQNLK